MKFKTFVKKHFSQKRYGEVILHEDLAAETIKAIKDAVASPYETRQQLQRWGYRVSDREIDDALTVTDAPEVEE